MKTTIVRNCVRGIFFISTFLELQSSSGWAKLFSGTSVTLILTFSTTVAARQLCLSPADSEAEKAPGLRATSGCISSPDTTCTPVPSGPAPWAEAVAGENVRHLAGRGRVSAVEVLATFMNYDEIHWVRNCRRLCAALKSPLVLWGLLQMGSPLELHMASGFKGTFILTILF